MAVANWNSEEALADVRLWPVLGFSKEADGGERKRSESLEERGGGERYGLGFEMDEILFFMRPEIKSDPYPPVCDPRKYPSIRWSFL